MPFSSPIRQGDLDAASIDIAVHRTSYEGHGGIDFNGVYAFGNLLALQLIIPTKPGTLHCFGNSSDREIWAFMDHVRGLQSFQVKIVEGDTVPRTVNIGIPHKEFAKDCIIIMHAPRGHLSAERLKVRGEERRLKN